MLDGYTEVSRDKWKNLQIGSKIRYMRVNGKFRGGGILINIWVGGAGKYEGKYFMEIKPQDYRKKPWKIKFEDVKTIWQMGAAGQTITFQKNNTETDSKVANLEDKVKYLQSAFDQVKIDLAKMSNETARIVNLIKRLHNIKKSPRPTNL